MRSAPGSRAVAASSHRKRRALSAAPGDPAATLGLARALAAGLLPQPAIARLREVVTRTPGDGEATSELAELSLRTGQPEAALKAITGAGGGYRQSREGALLEGRV